MSDISASVSQRPRILLIADVPDWIFARHCRMLERFLGDEFHFTVLMANQQFVEGEFDLIYPLEFNLVARERIKTPAKYVTGLRSYVSWVDQDFLLFAESLNTCFQKVHAVSRRLEAMFQPFVPSVTHLTHGVDVEFFKPQSCADLSGRCLRLGWAGNRVNATKGLEQFVTPLGKLPGVELVFCGYEEPKLVQEPMRHVFCGYQHPNLDLDQMRRFHDSIDAYICASSHEGNNNSLLEAAAMQRAIVTTDNGTVPEYLRHGESALIVARELPCFIEAVIRLRDHPEERLALGRKAREAVVAHFDWKQRAEDYRRWFRDALARRDSWRPVPGAVWRLVGAAGPLALKEPPHPTPPLDSAGKEQKTRGLHGLFGRLKKARDRKDQVVAHHAR
jgi:glycosyltransferase involved in cell wall biosynthesis